MSNNPHIGIIVGSTREGRFSERAAAWFHAIAARRTDLSVEMVDLRDYPMPFFAESASPAWMPPKDPAAVRWAAKLADFDGFVFVTPEYNHGYSAVLKNALDYAFQQFNRKPAAFVSYGGVGGARAIEQLRMVGVELQMAPTPKAVNIGMTEFLGIWQQIFCDLSQKIPTKVPTNWPRMKAKVGEYRRVDLHRFVNRHVLHDLLARKPR